MKFHKVRDSRRENGSESLNGPGTTTVPEFAAHRGQAALAAANLAALDPYTCARCGGLIDNPNGPRICDACKEAAA
jgi:hypothetical protein